MIPILDTNVFGHVQEGLISQDQLRQLLRSRPKKGWPLSAVTAIELLAGIDRVTPENFPQLRGQIDLAYRLSRGRILQEPRFLMCTEVLHGQFPTELVPPCAKILALYMDVARHARSIQEIIEARVPFRKGLTRGKGRAGFDPSVVTSLVSGPKNEWKNRIEALASDVYPQWREEYVSNGRRLPEGLRRDLERTDAWRPVKDKLAESIALWLGMKRSLGQIEEIADRLDAALEFTISVAREFLTRDYKLEKHESDIYDQFQLHYLAMDRFIIVSEDKKLSRRTHHSSQAGRILSFEKFLDKL